MGRFRLTPGYRARSEGDPVRIGDTIVLQSVKVPSMYLHCDTKQNDESPFKVSPNHLAKPHEAVPLPLRWGGM